MLNIPTDLAAWDPRDVTDWVDQVGYAAECGRVTDAEYARARRAVTVALLGDEVADEVHGGAV